MQSLFVRQITRRYPFKADKTPWIARVYCYPLERWSLARAALFGAPNFLLFLLVQRFSPIRPKGRFFYSIGGQKKPIRFNGLNTQFHAVYGKFFSGGYEPQTTALLDLLCPADGIFYDIGSNWGWFSLYLASKPGFQGKIHAFEPFPPSYADISSVVEQAGLTGQITCHNVALSDQAGEAFMHLPDHFQSGMATLKAGKSAGDQRTRVATLDSLNLAPPSLVKMDVEGNEIKALRGGAQTITRHQPMMVFENKRSSGNPMETLEPLFFLRDAGYQFFHVCWLKQTGKTSYLLGDDADPNPQDQETLALVPMEVEDRFLRYDGMNILACHKDKISQIKQLFQERTLP